MDVSSTPVPLDCPVCGAKLTVTLREVAQRATVRCNGCRQDVQLADKHGNAAGLIRAAAPVSDKVSIKLTSK